MLWVQIACLASVLLGFITVPVQFLDGGPNYDAVYGAEAERIDLVFAIVGLIGLTVAWIYLRERLVFLALLTTTALYTVLGPLVDYINRGLRLSGPRDGELDMNAFWTYGGGWLGMKIYIGLMLASILILVCSDALIRRQGDA